MQPSIAKISWRVRKEALPLFFQLNDFEAHIHRCDFSHFIGYAKRIKASKIRQIGRVIFTVSGFSSCTLTYGAGLEELVCWYASTNLRVDILIVLGCLLGEDRRMMMDAFHVATKLWNEEGGDEDVLRAFHEWLEKLGKGCHCEAMFDGEDNYTFSHTKEVPSGIMARCDLP